MLFEYSYIHQLALFESKRGHKCASLPYRYIVSLWRRPYINLPMYTRGTRHLVAPYLGGRFVGDFIVLLQDKHELLSNQKNLYIIALY